MSCPTCDHTMESIDRGTYWCPRCGTLRMLVRAGDVVVHTTDQPPKLVSYVRKSLKESPVYLIDPGGVSAYVLYQYNRDTLAEACLPPAERPGPQS